MKAEDAEKILGREAIHLDGGFRLDFFVADSVVVEVKAIDALLPIHQAQLLSYLKLGGWKLGLLMNFHAPLLREGIKRVVLGLEEAPKSTNSP
jgi:GxxExxY protein